MMADNLVQGKPETISNNGLTWIDIQKPTRDNIQMIGQKYSFHELNLEDCLSKTSIPKMDRYKDHIFDILHFPTVEKKEKSTAARFSQLSIFAGINFVVTVHQGNLKPLEEMFYLCKQSEKQREMQMGRSSGYLLHSIIDVLVDDLLHILMKVVGNLDDIEDVVFDEKRSDAKQISLLRREITTLRRIVIPLRRTVLDMTKDIQKFSEEDLTPYFADVEDHIEKILETLEESKETVEIYKDTDFMLNTEKSNKSVAVLTILFTLSIPATTISTFYGMNVDLPGSLGHPARFLGPYTTMILVIVASIISALLMVWYFYRLRWI